MICLAYRERHPLSACGVACNLEGLLSSHCIFWKLSRLTVQIWLVPECCHCVTVFSRL